MSTSFHRIPIFISSTVYNLIDLRAELADFLIGLGYDPKLSSESGFPDQTPELSPWESCLPVLEKSFIVVLVIDGQYGTPLPWVNYTEILGEDQISPTHGEYRFAMGISKRLLVFVRKEIMIYYQVYRKFSKLGYQKEDLHERLKESIPDRVDPLIFDFINEVKTTKPIPWITEFETVLDVKKEIRSKLNNELAEVFLAKDRHLDTLVKGINKVLQSSSEDERMVIIEKLDIQNDLTERYRITKEKLKSIEAELDKISTTEVKKRGELENEINLLKDEIAFLKSQSSSYRLNTSGSNSNLEFTRYETVNCEKCHCFGVFDRFQSGEGEVFACPSCGKMYCDNCNPRGEICADCKKGGEYVFIPVKA